MSKWGKDSEVPTAGVGNYESPIDYEKIKEEADETDTV